MNGLKVWLIVVRIESVRKRNAGILAPGNSTTKVSKGAIGNKQVMGAVRLVRSVGIDIGSGSGK